MTRRAPQSPHWLTLAVLLPLVLLGVLSWMGTNAQVKAAWATAKEEARAACRASAGTLSDRLAAGVETAPLFPDPPVPGAASDADAVLDEGDPASLRGLRDDPRAGISPAGLPRQVLAGLRLLVQGGDSADRSRLVALAVREEPSVLTSLVLEKADDASKSEWQRWRRGDKARDAFKRHPDLDSAGKWKAGPVAWLAKDGNTLRFIDGQAVGSAFADIAEALPDWAGLRVQAGGLMLFDALPQGEVMESVPVKFGDGLNLEILATRADLIEESARKQGTWTLSLLGCAVLVSGSALGMMHHSIRRERRLSEMKSQFVASVSHELRAPVASIRLMADSLEAEKVEPATAREFHRLIAREGARLSTLVANVLDHARIEQGRKLWKMEPCELTELAAETLRVMEPLAKERNIALVSRLQPVDAAVDAGAIQQALVNLLDNAIKFSPPGGQVTVALSESDRCVLLSVRDEGPGIPKNEQQRIFERFYRLGDELRRETQGTGIGLSLVKSIAEAHGGTVELQSEPGKGSEFTLKIPVSS